MAFTKFKKRNLNRYRKVYPYVRREPRMVLCSDKEVTMEVGSVTFNNDAVYKRFTFTEWFPGVPYVTALSVDSENHNSADLNVFVKVLTTTYVELEVSQTFVGKVHFHAIWVKP